ncbi:hypothetical protein CANMA_002280 [Candida margitis]|uniref:uncharacterized protein n=1 Tax=Candida margitis TaxID=1775924 RepID=UPI002225E67E|nr:uncharacterized protein CANMA_002280 [Candida margitis]KAI5968535.1 hypothetical protein CANMA_002280 [Candida margitis]
MLSDSDESPTADNHEYTIDDYYRLVKPLWSHKSVNFNHKFNQHKVLRTLVDFSLTRTMLLENPQKRSITIGDLSAIKSRNVDSIAVRIDDDVNNKPEIRSSIHTITSTDSEKTGATTTRHSQSSSTHGQQYRSCLRSKYVEFCPHTAISAYLFSRFHIPDIDGLLEFSQDSVFDINIASIYKGRLLKGNGKSKSLSSSQQLISSNRALEIAGFSLEETNLRKLLLAHTFEVPDKLSGNTISEVPFDALMQLAGFESVNEYSILRNSINPPQDLLDKIFPFINQSDKETQNKQELKSDDMFYDGIPPSLEPPTTDESKFQHIKELLRMLRKSLCQDMLVIRKRYPHNPLSKNEIFNSAEFEAFAREVENNGDYDRLIRESCFNPQDDETESDSDDLWPSSIDFDSKEDLHRVVEFQNNKLKSLEREVARSAQQQHETTNHLYDFISKQTEIMNKQSDFLRNIQNSINGLIILSSSKNKSSEYLAKQSLQDTARYINSGENQHIRAGIDNTLELLSRMRESQQRQSGGGDITEGVAAHHQSQVSQQNQSHSQSYYPPYNQQPPTAVVYQPQHYQTMAAASTAPTHRPSDASISTRSSMLSTTSPHFQPALSHFQAQQHQQHHLTQSPIAHTSLSNNPILNQPHPHLPHHSDSFQGAQPPQPPSSSSSLPQIGQQQQSKSTRQLVLGKRLSRQATTLYEMWDDFKRLEEELRQHEISVTEWLKVHGSSERQFRHTRLKIIKFVEEEAMRRSVPVEIVKEMLHNKMRNRLRPWTLDEVQRMLTSGRRIDLDDPRL